MIKWGGPKSWGYPQYQPGHDNLKPMPNTMSLQLKYQKLFAGWKGAVRSYGYSILNPFTGEPRSYSQSSHMIVILYNTIMTYPHEKQQNSRRFYISHIISPPVQWPCVWCIPLEACLLARSKRHSCGWKFRRAPKRGKREDRGGHAIGNWLMNSV